jgi:hypothetical protein
MNKHTPGTWKVDDSQAMTAINAENKHVAMVNFFKSGDGNDISGKEHYANANLIAAAQIY